MLTIIMNIRVLQIDSLMFYPLRYKTPIYLMVSINISTITWSGQLLCHN